MFIAKIYKGFGRLKSGKSRYRTAFVYDSNDRTMIAALSEQSGANFHSARITHLLIFAILAMLAACRSAEEPPPPEIRPVRVMGVEKRASGETVSLTGNVQAQTEVNLAFRIDGRMVQRNVDVGATIKPGQVVATLNADNEENALQSARANLAAARAQLVEARNNYDRHKSLLEQRFIAVAEFDRAAASLQTAQSQVDSAQAQVNIAQNRSGYTRLVADAGGTVTAVGAEPGEVVQAGRMIVQLARAGGRDAVFDVSPQIKDSAPANPEITVFLTADPKVSAKGRVREVSPRADPATGTFRIRVGLIDPPATMRLGTTVTGRMQLGSAAGIEIPPSAVIRSDRQSAVWIVDPKTGTVSMRNIEVGSQDSARVTVASGLDPGDVVVTAGVQALRPGQKVRLLETKQ
jgi:RND family efflux transporter MFP subunit